MGAVMNNLPVVNRSLQQGMVLLVTLIMIGLMSIVAVSAIRGSSMQEAMAGNLHDRNLAFQAAEAGLRIAEEEVSINGTDWAFDGTEAGLYPDQNKPSSTVGSVKNWTEEDWEDNSITLEEGDITLSEGVTVYPQYVIEKIGDFTDSGGSSTVYRITSRGFGISGSSEVIVQSTYEVADTAGSGGGGEVL
jgi:type IV pilus assembly protein PilX